MDFTFTMKLVLPLMTLVTTGYHVMSNLLESTLLIKASASQARKMFMDNGFPHLVAVP